ncbi:MAG: tetratricopeptide repeat protein [Thermodesulfovibrionales bacterium]|jgi:predicted negative regulator of RcsB-dependent stress response
MPKAIKKKIAKPAKKEEDVRGIIHEVRKSIAGRKKYLLPIVIIAAVAVIASAGFLMYRSSMNAKADALGNEGYQIYYGLYQKQPLQKEDHYQKALEKFQKSYEAKKSPISLFYIASCYEAMGKYDDSLKALKELNERFPDDEIYVPLAYYKMAMIDLKKGNTDEALKYLDTITNYKTGSFKDLALSESAKLLESMGKKEEAAKKYAQLKKDFPNSPFAMAGQGQAGEKKD